MALVASKKRWLGLAFCCAPRKPQSQALGLVMEYTLNPSALRKSFVALMVLVACEVSASPTNRQLYSCDLIRVTDRFNQYLNAINSDEKGLAKYFRDSSIAELQYLIDTASDEEERQDNQRYLLHIATIGRSFADIKKIKVECNSNIEATVTIDALNISSNKRNIFSLKMIFENQKWGIDGPYEYSMP